MMKIKEGFVLRKVDKKYIVIPVGVEVIEFTGIMTLNESGKTLFEALQKESTAEALTIKLVETYDVTYDEALSDVLDFIKTLKQYDLLV